MRSLPTLILVDEITQNDGYNFSADHVIVASERLVFGGLCIGNP